MLYGSGGPNGQRHGTMSPSAEEKCRCWSRTIWTVADRRAKVTVLIQIVVGLDHQNARCVGVGELVSSAIQAKHSSSWVTRRQKTAIRGCSNGMEARCVTATQKVTNTEADIVTLSDVNGSRSGTVEQRCARITIIPAHGQGDCVGVEVLPKRAERVRIKERFSCIEVPVLQLVHAQTRAQVSSWGRGLLGWVMTEPMKSGVAIVQIGPKRGPHRRPERSIQTVYSSSTHTCGRTAPSTFELLARL